MKKLLAMPKDSAEALAIQALTFIAEDGERLGQFLAATGIGPAQIRAASGEPGFLTGVLDYLVGDESLLAINREKIDDAFADAFAADALQCVGDDCGFADHQRGAAGRERQLQGSDRPPRRADFVAADRG